MSKLNSWSQENDSKTSTEMSASYRVVGKIKTLLVSSPTIFAQVIKSSLTSLSQPPKVVPFAVTNRIFLAAGEKYLENLRPFFTILFSHPLYTKAFSGTSFPESKTS